MVFITLFHWLRGKLIYLIGVKFSDGTPLWSVLETYTECRVVLPLILTHISIIYQWLVRLPDNKTVLLGAEVCVRTFWPLPTGTEPISVGTYGCGGPTTATSDIFAAPFSLFAVLCGSPPSSGRLLVIFMHMYNPPDDNYCLCVSLISENPTGHNDCC